METSESTVHPHFCIPVGLDVMLDSLNTETTDSGPLDNMPRYGNDVLQYLNDISDFVRNHLVAQNAENLSPFNLNYKINFISMGEKAPGNHPTHTLSKPDIVAFKRLNNADSLGPANLNWSNLVLVGEKLSKPTSVADSDAQGAAYSEFLLQARPDFVSVPGLRFSEKEFTIILTNAWGFYSTQSLPWSNDKNFTYSKRLLYALMKRLYIPHLDKRITVDDANPDPTFNVQTGTGLYPGTHLLRTGLAIGRRTTVWLAKKEGHEHVIKEQYIEVGCRFEEGKMLDKIHEGGSFPGLVRAIHHGPAMCGEKAITIEDKTSPPRTRKKTEIVLQDKGDLLMKASTPREFLMALYDLLEVTRMLWRKYRILHRDISDSNVLIREKIYVPNNPLEIPDMCFSAHLLGEMKKAKGDPTEPPSKLATRVILIDFDMSEDQGVTEVSTDRIGTALFMARFVRNAKYPTGIYALPAMPELDSECRDAYIGLFGNRLIQFPEIDEEIIEIRDPMQSPNPKRPFRHKLRYDAESTFWLFLWWAIHTHPPRPKEVTIHAQPPRLKEEIDLEFWNPLTSDKDRRDENFINRFPSDILHPSYAPLEQLLRDMAAFLQGDLDFTTDQHRKQEEYMHEAFQRLILQFLFQNDGESFMGLAKDPMDRLPAKNNGMSGTPTGSKRNSDSISGGGGTPETNKKQKHGSQRPTSTESVTETPEDQLPSDSVR